MTDKSLYNHCLRTSINFFACVKHELHSGTFLLLQFHGADMSASVYQALPSYDHFARHLEISPQNSHYVSACKGG